METKWEINWEKVTDSTERLPVNGGHLYRDQKANALAMCFVPDIDLTRYESHLRDAYTQGFANGLEEGKANKELIYDENVVPLVK